MCVVNFAREESSSRFAAETCPFVKSLDFD